MERRKMVLLCKASMTKKVCRSAAGGEASLVTPDNTARFTVSVRAVRSPLASSLAVQLSPHWLEHCRFVSDL